MTAPPPLSVAARARLTAVDNWIGLSNQARAGPHDNASVEYRKSLLVLAIVNLEQYVAAVAVPDHLTRGDKLAALDHVLKTQYLALSGLAYWLDREHPGPAAERVKSKLREAREELVRHPLASWPLTR